MTPLTQSDLKASHRFPDLSEGEPSFRSLLYMCEYPPSTLAGAPVIAKQLFRNYDLSQLHVLCCQHEVEKASELVHESFLDCDHTFVPSYATARLRPRRIFIPMKRSINCLRVSRILREARRIVDKNDIEAIFTIPWRCEFALAAYRLHQETGLPLYVFETDDWEAMNPRLVQGYLTRHYHAPLLEAAEQLWVTSPNMQHRFHERFGVKSEFLFHFVDLDEYQNAAERMAPQRDPSRVEMVYTGSINRMFYDTMKYVCDLLNRGLTVDGRPVSMKIYGPGCPDEFQGPHVSYEGLVDLDEIPNVLGAADIAFVGVTFSQDSKIKELVSTSLYTKTIDYLASGRPVLVVSPSYSGEVDYFQEVTTVVDTLNESDIVSALRRMLKPEYAQAIRQKGLQLVRNRHSMQSIHDLFLKHFTS